MPGGRGSVDGNWRALVVLVVLACLAASAPTLCAQEQRGGLRGRVVDKDFGVAIPGVSLSISGTGQRTESDGEGNFFLGDLAPGSYDISLQKEGYIREMVREMSVIPGQVREVTFEITSDVTELDEFVVSGEDLLEPGELGVIDIKTSLDAFADAIGGEFLARSGASDAGGALQKVVGTSVVDSKYVVVRGLSDRYNVVVLNGARIPSSDPNKRAVNIDIFPTGLIDSLVTAKTFTPDLPGESTGGYINIITKGVPREPFVKVSVGLGFNTQSTYNPDFLTYRGGGTGMLGTADERMMPGVIRGTTAGDLPPQTITVFEPPRPNRPNDVRNSNIRDLRNEVAAAFRGTSMGVTTTEAPPDFSFSASAGTNLEFMGRPLGLIGAMTYGKKYRLKEGVRSRVTTSGNNNIVEQARLDTTEGVEELLAGMLLSATYEWTDDDIITATYFGNIAADDSAIFQLGVRNGLTRPELFAREVLSYTERRLSTYQIAGRHGENDDERVKVTWSAAYSDSSQEEPDQRFSNYVWNPSTRLFSGLPGADFKGLRFERAWRRLDDTNYNGNLNIELPLFNDPEEDKRISFKFGGSIDQSSRDFLAENLGYAFGDIGKVPAFPGTAPVIDPDDRVGQTPGDLLASYDLRDDPISTIPPNAAFPNGAALYNDRTFALRPTFPPATERYEASQTLAAGYGMFKADVTENLELLFGARIETTDISIRSDIDLSGLDDPEIIAIVTSDPSTGEPYEDVDLNNVVISRNDLLPALNATWEIFEDMRLRAAVSRTVARPTFKEIAPTFTRDPGSSDFQAGNVGLRVSDIVNYDIRWEWFPSGSDVVAVSGFSKEIRDPIELFQRGDLTQFGNESEAIVYGMEIELRKDLETFGDALRGVSAGFNFSKIFSNVSLSPATVENRRRAGLETSRRLQGQPDYTMNFDITYDDPDLGLEAALLLNVTGEVLYQVGGFTGEDQFPDIFQKPFTTLDFTLSKSLTDRIKLRFRIANILNSTRERVYTGGSPYETVQEGTTYSVGIGGEW